MDIPVIDININTGYNPLYYHQPSRQIAQSNKVFGSTGPTGSTGNPGADSTVPGPQGIQGPQGNPGADSTVPGPQGPQGNPGADSTVPGPQGPQGNPGADSTVPGPQGIQGPQGDPGADSTVPGPQGIQGPQGNPGADSTVPGPQGIQGPQGNPGADSTVPGPQGIQGPQGNPGADSTVPGPQGPQGPTGANAAYVYTLCDFQPNTYPSTPGFFRTFFIVMVKNGGVDIGANNTSFLLKANKFYRIEGQLLATGTITNMQFHVLVNGVSRYYTSPTVSSTNLGLNGSYLAFNYHATADATFAFGFSSTVSGDIVVSGGSIKVVEFT